MLAFTLLGLVTFWLACFRAGYELGLLLDVLAWLQDYANPFRCELEELAHLLSPDPQPTQGEP